MKVRSQGGRDFTFVDGVFPDGAFPFLSKVGDFPTIYPHQGTSRKFSNKHDDPGRLYA
jgi:hypothetical protein